MLKNSTSAEIIQRIIEVMPQGVLTTKYKNKLYTMSKLDLRAALDHWHTPDTLKLHERYWDDEIRKDILRVPSGWLYYDYNTETDAIHSPVFVPFSNSPIIIRDYE